LGAAIDRDATMKERGRAATNNFYAINAKREMRRATANNLYAIIAIRL